MGFFSKISELVLGKKSNNNKDRSLVILGIYDNNITEKINEQKAIFLSKTSKNGIQLRDSDDKYPSTLQFWYDIKNIRQFHIQLINEGYYRESTLQEILYSKTIPEIKEIASKYGIIVKGKKEDIVNQVSEGLSNEQRDIIVSQNKLYSVSDKGKDYLEKYKDFLVLAENYMWNIDMKRLSKLRAEHRNIIDIYELAALDLEGKIPIYNNRKEYSKACVAIIALKKIYLDKEKFDSAMKECLLKVLYDINYVTYQGYGWSTDKSCILSSLEFCIKNGGGCIAPVDVEIINKYGQLIDDDMIYNTYYKYNNSFYYIVSLSLFKDMIHSILDGNFNEKKYLSIIYDKIRS